MNLPTDIRLVPRDSLKPGRNLAKKHPESQVAKIAGLITEFGWTNPILIDGNDNILAGRGRWIAAGMLGIELVPCICIDHLTEKQAQALMLADNRVAESEWDLDILKAELADLDADMLGLTGFDFAEIDKILEGALTADAVEEEQKLPKVEFLNIGKHKIELTPEEKHDLVALTSEWSGHHGSYRGFIQHVLDAVRNYNGA